MSSLSLNTFLGLRERARVRGLGSTVSHTSCFVPTKHSWGNEAGDSDVAGTSPPLPASPPESPKKQAIRGERREVGCNADPGRRARPPASRLPWARLGCPFRALRRKQRRRAAALLEKRPISRFPRKREPGAFLKGWHGLQEPGLDSRPGLLSAGVTFFRGNDGIRALFATTYVTVLMDDST